MLEFLKNGATEECFTFSVPPESEDFQFPQRLTETKTFGGSIFEDYGNDTYKITLSGSTINEDKKFIYKGGKIAPQYLSGTKEIFSLQEIIRDWNRDISAQDKKVYLYDLSKMSVLQIAAGTASRNYWRVFIRDLKIKRDASRPNAYRYTLEMSAVEDDPPNASGPLAEFSEVADQIQDIAESVSAVMTKIEGATAAMNQATAYCAEMKRAWQTMRNSDITPASVTLMVAGALDSVSRVLGGNSNGFYNSAKNLLEAVSTLKGLAGAEESGEKKNGKTETTNQFKIYFESSGGSAVNIQTVKWKECAVKPVDPVKERYAFDGWFTDPDCTTEYDFAQKVTQPMTLYAKWSLSTAKITYNALNNKVSTAQYVPVGKIAAPPENPEKSGWVFSHWCTDAACTKRFDFEITPIDGDIVLYAAWDKLCNVFFDSDGGTKIETQFIKKNGLACYPLTPEKTNYVFLHWVWDDAGGAVFDFSSPITDDVTLRAAYVHVSNTLSFHSMGGSAVADQTVKLGELAQKPENPIREGYSFDLWTTDEEGTNEFFFDTKRIDRDTTLFANWSDVYLSVTFDSDGGTPVDSQSVRYGQKAVFPEIPEKTGASFRRWRIQSDGAFSEFDFSTPVKTNLTLVAEWFGGVI